MRPDNADIADVTPVPDAVFYNNYMCWENRTYNSCKDNFWLYLGKCYKCPDGWSCVNGTMRPVTGGDQCGNYVGSLYQKMVVYALQYCVRPSESNNPIPNEVLGYVNQLMDTVRTDMSTVLAEECEKVGGEWVRDFAKSDEQTCEPANLEKNTTFYNTTNANLCWGLCKKKTEQEDTGGG